MSFLTKMYVHMQTKMQDEEGATMVEYALMVALIAIVAMVGAGVVGTNAETIFQAIAAKLTVAAPPAG